MVMKIDVKNVPPYAESYEWVVARNHDGELWFWGAYHDKQTAWKVAEEVGGVYLQKEMYKTLEIVW